MSERLQKIMAQAGLGSRRHNEALIAEGLVKINGRVARLGDKADPMIDRIIVDGKALELSEMVYVKLNKPKGIISSLKDELNQGRTTVRDLIPIEGHIFPIGRLDKQSEGLMILTNDGEMANRLTHPRYQHQKVYRVSVEGWISDRILSDWRNGLKLDGQLTLPAEIEVLDISKKQTWLRIKMREGRKRQIRRIAAFLGHPVNRLVREQIGPITLGGLSPGDWRHLNAVEMTRLRKLTGLRDTRSRLHGRS